MSKDQIITDAIIFPDDTVPPTFDRLTSSHVLPWGAPKERSRFPSSFNIETDIRPGEFVMRTLFAEFTVQVNGRISLVEFGIILVLK